MSDPIIVSAIVDPQPIFRLSWDGPGKSWGESWGEFYRDFGKILSDGGFIFVPNPILKDDQIMVSENVYREIERWKNG